MQNYVPISRTLAFCAATLALAPKIDRQQFVFVELITAKQARGPLDNLTTRTRVKKC